MTIFPNACILYEYIIGFIIGANLKNLKKKASKLKKKNFPVLS
jgi:hypothetical protein